MTPSSIKAFVQYFANDVLGVQYALPRDLLDANLALTEALFYRCVSSAVLSFVAHLPASRRIHSHVLKYSSPAQREKDEKWRVQCQLCRLVDPLSYHVPAEYLFGKHPAPCSTDEASSPASKAAPHEQFFATPPAALCPVPATPEPLAGVKLDADFRMEGEQTANPALEGVDSAGSADAALTTPQRPAASHHHQVLSPAPSDAALRATAIQSAALMDSLTWTPTPAEVSTSGPHRHRHAKATPADKQGQSRGLHSGLCSCLNCRTFSYSLRLQRLARFSEAQFGAQYARAARVMSFIASSATPKVRRSCSLSRVD